MIKRFVNAYRTRRWLRWSIDLSAVLVLMLVVAVAHTLLLSNWPPLAPYSLYGAISK